MVTGFDLVSIHICRKRTEMNAEEKETKNAAWDTVAELKDRFKGMFDEDALYRDDCGEEEQLSTDNKANHKTQYYRVAVRGMLGEFEGSPSYQDIKDNMPDAEFEPMINIAHNYAAWEHHFDEDVIVHRKGATRAREGEIGIIPGSQGTKSYITEGLGNPASFMSCSHGAGRVMSRTEAVKTLSLTDEQAKLDAKGIVHALRCQKDLEEASSAYKDIDEVMANQTDLTRIVTPLEPVAVIKGV